MLALRNTSFRFLFAAQIMSLLGTGILTVALALLSYEMGGAQRAGMLLGLIFTLKMVAYVGFAPLANTFAERLPPKPVLIGLDFARVALTLAMPFADGLWQIYGLVLLFFLCAAAFTPTFQSVIPQLLPDKAAFTSGLALSRSAYTLESMLSPLAAGLLLSFIEPRFLFFATVVSFVASALLILLAPLKGLQRSGQVQSFVRRLTKGFDIFLRTPRLRGLMAVNLALSLSMSWVLVNSVGYAGQAFDGNERVFTWLMTAFGVGSIASALSVPWVLERVSERRLMLSGTMALGILPLCILLPMGLTGALFLWAGLGAASSLVLIPGGLLIVRSAAEPDRPALFAAQFSLSHAAWLIAYPLAGYLGLFLPIETVFLVLAAGTLVMTGFANLMWPRNDEEVRQHIHTGMASNHPHAVSITGSQVVDSREGQGIQHAHRFQIDDFHRNWSGPASSH